MACDRSLSVRFGASLDLIRISANAVGERGATLSRKEAGELQVTGCKLKTCSLRMLPYWSFAACCLLPWERLYT